MPYCSGPTADPGHPRIHGWSGHSLMARAVRGWPGPTVGPEHHSMMVLQVSGYGIAKWTRTRTIVNKLEGLIVVSLVAIVECVACVGHQGYRLCRAPGAPTSRASGAPCRYPYELMVQLWIFIDTHGCATIMYI